MPEKANGVRESAALLDTIEQQRRALVALALLAAAKDRARTVGGYPPPQVDPEWANPNAGPPPSATDDTMPRHDRYRCPSCGHMRQRHGALSGCVVLVETNFVNGVATRLEQCGCREGR
jgi:hypothetical protein